MKEVTRRKRFCWFKFPEVSVPVIYRCHLVRLCICLPACLLIWSSVVLAADGEPAEVECGYDKGFYVQSGEQKLKLYGYMQTLWTGEFDSESLNTNEFRARRGRFLAAGSATRSLDFKMHVDFTSSRPLLDYYLDYRPRSSFGLRMGQYKAPLARQYLVSATKKEFVDDTIATNAFKLDRDIGAMAHGNFAGGKFDYQVGLFNGAGKNARQDNTDLMYAARLVLNPLGSLKLTESDVSGTKEPRLSTGLAIAFNTVEIDAATEGKPAITTAQLTLAGELAFFYRGFFAAAELFRRNDDPQKTGDDLTSAGGYLQAGYLVVPPQIEIAARAAMVRKNTEVSDDDQLEIGLALNRFFTGHRLKLQLDYAALVDEVPGGSDEADHRVRLQLQAMY